MRVEEWVEKCDRLATFGSQYDLPGLFKTVPLQQMLIGETRRASGVWEMDGLPYEELLVKLKEYARSQRLDGEASRGKQAVDINQTNAPTNEEGAQEEEQPARTEEELSAFANVKWFYCNKKGALHIPMPIQKD